MTEVHRLYHRFAARFDRDRSRSLMELSYLEALQAQLGKTPAILDLGCGMGEPIARFFIERGCRVTGVDAAPAMIDLCRSRFPAADWVLGDMRGLALPTRFNGIIAWDSLFHLSADDQRGMFPLLPRLAAPGALLLMTTGPMEGVAVGELYGQPLYHASLDPQEYRQLLDFHGFRVILYNEEDPQCGRHTVWLAQYQGAQLTADSGRGDLSG